MANIVITGTSQGIGLELTRQALENGDRVLALARPSGHIQELQNLGQKHSLLQVLLLDLRQDDAISQVKQALEGWSGIDILVNNAGIYRPDESAQDFLASFETNTIIPFFLTRALMPQLQKSSTPKVAHISSMMGSIADNSSGGSYSYRASKAAVNMISKGFSVEEPWLLSVVLHPGWVQTQMGGEGAPVGPADSAAGLWRVIRGLEKNQSGRFFDFRGEELPW